MEDKVDVNKNKTYKCKVLTYSGVVKELNSDTLMELKDLLLTGGYLEAHKQDDCGFVFLKNDIKMKYEDYSKEIFD